MAFEFDSECLHGLPHETVLGTASNGVVGYNCNYRHILPLGDSQPYDHLNYVRDARGKLQYSGDKWQCVEFARRTWILQLDVYLPNTARACDIWDRVFVKRLSDNARVSLQKYTSGVTHHRPAVNDLIIWKKSDNQPFGHVAVVSEVTDTYVRIGEQNAQNDVMWVGGHWSREFPLTCDNGVWTMHDKEDPLFGWVRLDFTNVATALPWCPPDEDRTSVDGEYGFGSASALQKFLGIHADGDHGRFTDLALAAFLNTQHQTYEHIVTPFVFAPVVSREPLIRKLQNLLKSHPLISGDGSEIFIEENGQFDVQTIKGLQNLLNRVTHADDFEAAAAVYKAGGGPPPRPNLPHGTILGTAHSGVIGYNCNYQNIVDPPADEPPYDNLVYVRDLAGRFCYSGIKWQCVEYARRWWISQLDVYLHNVPRACDIWTRTYVTRLSDKARVALQMHDNGVSTDRPAVGDLLIWIKTDEQPVGHVAVVCDVTDEHVCIAEQNVDNNKMWSGGHYSRKFALQRHEETGAWTIRDDEDPMFGWVRCLKDVVVPTPPFVPPTSDRLPVNGVLDEDTKTAIQMFVGFDVKRDLGDVDLTTARWKYVKMRMTDNAMAVFLNTVHQSYAHVPMPSFRALAEYKRDALIKKVQHFLNAYPEMSGAGDIPESGEWCAETTKGCQNLLNKVYEGDHFLEAVELYRGKL